MVAKSQTGLSKWTELDWYIYIYTYTHIAIKIICILCLHRIKKKWSIYRCLIIYIWSAGNVSNVFTGGTVVKNPPVDAGETGDVGSIPRLGRILGERNSNPLQYSFLENWMDTGAWWATAHGVTKNRTWLSMHTLPKCIKDLTSTLSVVLSVPVTEVAIQELLSFSLFFFFFIGNTFQHILPGTLSINSHWYIKPICFPQSP